MQLKTVCIWKAILANRYDTQLNVILLCEANEGITLFQNSLVVYCKQKCK